MLVVLAILLFHLMISASNDPIVWFFHRRQTSCFALFDEHTMIQKKVCVKWKNLRLKFIYSLL